MVSCWCPMLFVHQQLRVVEFDVVPLLCYDLLLLVSPLANSLFAKCRMCSLHSSISLTYHMIILSAILLSLVLCPTQYLNWFLPLFPSLCPSLLCVSILPSISFYIPSFNGPLIIVIIIVIVIIFGVHVLVPHPFTNTIYFHHSLTHTHKDKICVSLHCHLYT